MKSNDNDEWVVCRTCLKQPQGDLQQLFDENPEHDLGSMLAECSGLPAALNDGFPDKICLKCLKYLKVAYKFRITCRRSYEYLSQNILKPEETEQQMDYQRSDEPTEYQISTVTSNVAFKVELEDNSEETENIHINNDEEAETLEIFMPLEDFQDTEDINEDVYEEFQLIEQADSSVSDEIVDEIISGEIESDEEFLPSPRVKNASTAKRGSKQLLKSGVQIKQEHIIAKIPDKRGRKKLDRPRLYICDVCGNSYPTQGRLTEHMKFHSDIKPHECEICGRGFVQAQQLVRHMNTHTGNRPYKCNYCPAAFADRSTKTKHHRIHTNEKPYVCDVCSRAFTYSDNLKFHKMLHTGEKPHVCDICGKGFTKAYKLKCHKVTHEKKGVIPMAATETM